MFSSIITLFLSLCCDQSQNFLEGLKAYKISVILQILNQIFYSNFQFSKMIEEIYLKL